MLKYWIMLFVVFTPVVLSAQQFSMSLGVFTGITTSFTLDNGIEKDPRYTESYQVKFAPVGINFGMDYEGIGFAATPGLVNLGQTFYVVNTSGGQNGKREINLKYLNLPVAFKVHIINLSFFKISGLVSFGAAYLLQGSETITHTETKLIFPTEVYPILPPDYVIEYDGVAVPAVHNYVISKKEDFNSLQFFAGAGFRSDWDVSNHWRVCVDFRLNYGLSEPRTDAYLSRVQANQTLYDLPGKRHELFPQLSVGISRYVDFEKSDQERKKKLRGSSKKFKPTQHPNTKLKNNHKPRQ